MIKIRTFTLPVIEKMVEKNLFLIEKLLKFVCLILTSEQCLLYTDHLIKLHFVCVLKILTAHIYLTFKYN